MSLETRRVVIARCDWLECTALELCEPPQVAAINALRTLGWSFSKGGGSRGPHYLRCPGHRQQQRQAYSIYEGVYRAPVVR